MDAHFGILTGTRAGEVFTWSRDAIAVGRHLDADLRFDPERERAVSARHALVFLQEERWFIRDLGSTNGTLVNGERIEGDVPLRDGDRVSFGAEGPTAEFRLSRNASPAAIRLTAATGGSNPSTVERVRVQLTRRTRLLWLTVGGGVVVLATVVAGTLFFGGRREAAWDRERAAMRLRIDSIQWAGARAVDDLRDQLGDLTQALQRSEERIRALTLALTQAEASGQTSQAQDLRRRLGEATSTLQRQQVAAGLDFRAIQGRNRPAVAMIYVEFADGQVVTATAFAVRPDATLITNRHVVAGENGASRPRRIAIQFSDSDQVWPARVLAVSRDSDLAVIKVDNIVGEVPVVRSLNLRADTVAAESPVATIGFPLGGASGRAGAVRLIRPVISAGVLRGSSGGRVEVQGYGAVGASGSPILDANGEVLAVALGGRMDEDGHTLIGVPASAAARLLAEIP